MSIAVGMVETLGFPAVVEAADAMVKAARVEMYQKYKLQYQQELITFGG